jgi:hypothetical protein
VHAHREVLVYSASDDEQTVALLLGHEPERVEHHDNRVEKVTIGAIA